MQVGKLFIYASFLSSFLLCGCSRPDYADFIEESLNKNNPDFRNLFDTIVIIPRLGCNSCTRDADRYYRLHKESSDIMFIFTNLQSKKMLRIENGSDIESRSNVYIDEGRSFWSPEYEESEYPTILTRDAGGHLTYEYLLEGYRLMELD